MSLKRFPPEEIRTKLSKDNLEECKKIFDIIKNMLLIEEQYSPICSEPDDNYCYLSKRYHWRKVKWEPKEEKKWRRLTFNEFLDFYNI